MTTNQGITDSVHSPIDAVSSGLDLDSNLNNFAVSFSTDARFSNDRPNNSVISLDKEWTDDMGLHLLQRSMLPPRTLKCIITLAGNLRITEDYGGAMKQSVKVPLNELVLDEPNTTLVNSASSTDYILQMKLAEPSRTFSLEDNFDNFDRRKFHIGGPAIQEVKARGFQLAELEHSDTANNSTSYEPILSKCRFLRITIKNWRNVTNPEVFSPEITSMIGNAGIPDRESMKRLQESSVGKTEVPFSQQSTNPTTRQPFNTKRPCSCWKRDENGSLAEEDGRTNNEGTNHSDACASQWAALFGGYMQQNKLRQTRASSGGMMASRWASGA